MSSLGSLTVLLCLHVHCLLGLLLLRYCTARFATRIPAWRSPVSGHVACLVTADHDVSGANGDEVSSREVHCVSGSGPGKRIRLNRKSPAHLAGSVIHSRPRVWKRLRHVGFSGVSMLDHTRRRCDHAYGGDISCT